MRCQHLSIAVLTVALLGAGAKAGAGEGRQRDAVRSPAGPVAYVLMDGSDSIAVVDLEQRKVVDRIEVEGNPHGGAITPDGGHIYTASMGANAIHVVDTRARTVTDYVETGSITHHSVASADGRYVYIAADQVLVIDVADNHIVASIATEEPPFHLAFSPDGDRLYALGIGSSIAVIDPEARRTIATISMTGTSRMGHLAVHPDGHELYATNDVTDSVSVVDVGTHREVARIPVGKGPHAIAVTGDGRRIIVGNRGQTDISVIDTRSREVVATHEIGQRPEHLTMSRDGRFLLLSRNVGANQVLMIDPGSLETLAAIDVWEAPHAIVLAGERPE